MRSNNTTVEIDFWWASVMEMAMLARESTWESRDGDAGIVVAEFPRPPSLVLVEVGRIYHGQEASFWGTEMFDLGSSVGRVSFRPQTKTRRRLTSSRLAAMGD